MTARSALAAALTRTVSATSRRLGLGGGSTVGGRIGLAVDPRLLERLSARRDVALVSGTNGKTTTTRLLVEALGGPAKVASSPAGANMPAGCVAALAGAPQAVPAVLEVDEGYLPRVAAATEARVVVLLNLSRDQLDRVGEVRMVATRWREALAGFPATIVANADDPLVAWAAGQAADVRWVAAGGQWHADAYHCPNCDARIEFPINEGEPWRCACGLERPEPFARLVTEVLFAGGASHDVTLSLPGRFNRANAAMAAVAAEVLGVPITEALAKMGEVREVAGRFATGSLAGTDARLLLAKNPAGWTELIELLAEDDRPAVVGINARDADGHDPSWLWDVPFERLAGRSVVATGERRQDLAVRLRHAGVEHAVVENQLEAFHVAPGAALDYIGNYTAFQQVRRALAASPTAPRHAPPSWHAARLAVTPSVAPLVGDPLGDRVVVDRPVAERRAGRESALRIVVVHPDLLGTYGDAGNAIVLANRAAWRGLPVELVLCPSDRPLVASGDIYCLGGGEDGPQVRSAERLGDGSLERARDNGAYVLAVCAGYQILGESFPGPGGRRAKGLGLLAVDTERGTGPRSVGELVVRLGPGAEPLGLRVGTLLHGFENHAGATRLGGAAPLGEVLAGTGNGRHATVEGAVGERIVGTYLHGPVLARNPVLADALLAAVTGLELDPLDDDEELSLRAARLAAARIPDQTPTPR